MKRPNVAVVNCDLLGPDGAPATVLRPMTDAEFEQHQLDQAVRVDDPQALVEAREEAKAELAAATTVDGLKKALERLL